MFCISVPVSVKNAIDMGCASIAIVLLQKKLLDLVPLIRHSAEVRVHLIHQQDDLHRRLGRLDIRSGYLTARGTKGENLLRMPIVEAP